MLENQVIITKNARKQFLLLLGSTLFVIVSVYMINGNIESSRYSPEFLYIIGIIGFLFFGLAGISILFSLAKFSPALIINEQGIKNHSSAGSSYFITWDNIKSLRIIAISGKKLIAIKLKDDQKVFEQVNLITRFLMKLNNRFYGSPAYITTAMIDIKIETVLKTIRDQKPRKSATKNEIPSD
ncbi:STM3941 family protein [Fluviicola taffensis]|uniref:STM3941 family protein n=1 Tax=Fluviicola taffensis TaxID=191579 RepID=UPI003137AFDB